LKVSITKMLLSKLAIVKGFFGFPFPTRFRSILLDSLDLTSKRGLLIPPLKLRRYIGKEDWKNYDNISLLTENCGLKPNHKILDVGCGCGRTAISLTSYLNSKGSYDGLDIVKDFIDWLQNNVTPKYPNFHFQHANIKNPSYNLNGTIADSKFKFPYESNSFDIVFLFSVFTHMLPLGIENYFSEIARVLKPNGKCAISYFLLPSKSMTFVDTGKGYSVIDFEIPENAVAYKLEHVMELYTKNELLILEHIYGFQDMIIAKKGK